ncbi:MAG: PilZ domain-containing protein [Gammaproteobacteria bacterium]|nr:PilZ domain-containing protein [Gammaproteobacteria bacterium]
MSTESDPQRERRKYPRSDVSMEVVIILPDETNLIVHTGNTSDGGALLLGDENELPEVGTEIGITVRSPIAGRKAPVHPARVVRKTRDGIGIQLLIPGTLNQTKP